MHGEYRVFWKNVFHTLFKTLRCSAKDWPLSQHEWPIVGLAESLPKRVGEAVLVDCLLRMGKPTGLQSRVEIMQGTLDMLILRTLQWGAQHGHGIGQAIRARSDEALQIEHGSLYPALHRLERRGWLKSEWRASESNRRAKYYSLTQSGRKQLLAEQSKWNDLVKTIARVMKPA